MLTVSQYSNKYGISKSSVYNSLYAGRIMGSRTASGWLVEDVPPPMRNTKPCAATIDDFDAYELTLLWLNGTVMCDEVIIRSKHLFVPAYFAGKFSHASWVRESGSVVCKISSRKLVCNLRELGFTGRKDQHLPPPAVDDTAAFAAAFIESRASFVRSLRYDKKHPMDKAHAYYVPAISMCASFPILQSAVYVLNHLGIIPLRRLSHAANGTSATLKITAWSQLDKLRNVLSVSGKDVEFWQAFDRHLQTPYTPYNVVKSFE